MDHYLASRGDRLRTTVVKRFLPRLWTVDFPRPMMAAVTNPAAGTIRVDLEYLTGADLAGLVWESEDRWSHPLLGYDTDRDYRGVKLRVDWAADPGLMPLDGLFGAVLTVEGRDAAGALRVWYVRLWNYAVGTGMAAAVALDFDELRAGFGPGGERVFAGDIDRMFISLVPAAFGGAAEPLSGRVVTGVELRNVRATGRRSGLILGDAFLPEHRLRMASGYDDSYHQAPERLVEQWRALGYRNVATHYVGMSHYPALRPVGEGRYEVAGGLCAPCIAWHRRLLLAADSIGMAVILSLSFELFDAHAPAAWAQRDRNGGRALTGWEPPSTLLSPCNGAAMGWLQQIAGALVALAAEVGVPLMFQVGEPWWWVNGSAPCFHDAAAVAAWVAERGVAPPDMANVAGERTADERDWLDWLGARLAAATASVAGAARLAGAARTHLLFYAPQVLDSGSPELIRANMPVGWARPAFDVLQLEDYDFVTGANEAGQARGRREVGARLGYPVIEQHYLAGFVLRAADAAAHWPRIAAAAASAMAAGVPEVFVWAWPQVARDGFVAFDLAYGRAAQEETDVEHFHDGLFPLALGFGASGGPQFQTQVATTASGHEQRNSQWASATLRYDAGVGVRSERDLRALLAFFRARRGQAQGFRFRDPMDHGTGAAGAAPSATDVLIGTGDGTTLRFPLVKRYGDEDGEVRRITRPVAGSVRLSLDGVEQPAGGPDGWAVEPGGILAFAAPVAVGKVIRAGFEFDVPVRFGMDQLDISLTGWEAGDVPSVPLMEVRE